MSQEFASGQVVRSVTDGRLEKSETLHRGEPRNLGRRLQASGSPALSHAHVARGVSPFLLRQERPVVVYQAGTRPVGPTRPAGSRAPNRAHHGGSGGQSPPCEGRS